MNATNLLADFSTAEILDFLNEFYPNGLPAWGIKWEGRSVKQWQAGRRINWKYSTQGKYKVLCPLKAVRLEKSGDVLKLHVGSITCIIK